MKSFLRFITNVCTTFLGISLFFFCLLAVASRLIRNAVENQAKEIIPDNSEQVLHIKLAGYIHDVRELDSFASFLENNRVYTNELEVIFEKVAKDDDIKAVYIEMQNFSMGLVTLERIAKMIEKLRKSGKLIVCYSSAPCKQFHLYLGAHADYHMVHPLANIHLEGFSIKRAFFKTTLDWIGIKVNAFYGGDTKNGLDAFVRTSMKPAVKKRYYYLISDMQELIHTTISRKRHLDKRLLEEVADLVMISPWEALDLRIIDGVGYMHDIKKILQKAPRYVPAPKNYIGDDDHGKPRQKVESFYEEEGNQTNTLRDDESSEKNNSIEDNEEGNSESQENRENEEQEVNKRKEEYEEEVIEYELPIYFVSLDTYIKRIKKRNRNRPKRSIRQQRKKNMNQKIAYIHLKGEIISGESSPGYIGDKDTIPMLYKAAKNHNIIVIHIDSPGGDVIPSDSIRAAVADISRKKGKAVIAVMGNICASGGLLIALGANLIWCYKSTITLSIGVYTGIFHGRSLFSDRCRIGVDGTKTNRPSDMHQGGAVYPPIQDRDLSDQEKDQWQLNIDDTYDYFLDLVSRNGRVSDDDVEAVAGGFVCLGEEAAYYGVVDEIIEDLQESLRKFMLAKYQDESYSIKYYTYSNYRGRYLSKYLKNLFSTAILLPRFYEHFIKSMKKGNYRKKAYTDLSFNYSESSGTY